MKVASVSLDLWRWEGAIVVGRQQDFLRWAKRVLGFDLPDMPGAAGRAYLEAGKPWGLWVERLSDTATLAHEALHITSGVLQARGLTFTEASEEAYAYTLSAIINAAKEARYREVRE